MFFSRLSSISTTLPYFFLFHFCVNNDINEFKKDGMKILNYDMWHTDWTRPHPIMILMDEKVSCQLSVSSSLRTSEMMMRKKEIN